MRTTILYSIVLIATIFTAACSFLEKDKLIVAYREIEVKNKDSLIKANIMISGEKEICDRTKLYFWFYDGQIFKNQGGISGYLLHGSYKVFNPAGAMICSGNFNKGLKDATWRYWYNNGILKREEKYRNGILNPKVTKYNEKGELIRENTKFSLFKKKNNHSDTLINKKSSQDYSSVSGQNKMENDTSHVSGKSKWFRKKQKQ